MEGFIFNLVCTVLMVGIYLRCMKKRGRIDRIMGVSGFFVTGCFLDRLCGLVMEGIMQEAARGQMWFSGLVLSKSMAGILLIPLCGIREESYEGTDADEGRPANYVEKLAVAGTVFFWCLLTAAEAFPDRGLRSDTDLGRGSILILDFIRTCFLFAVFMGFTLSVYRFRRAEHGRQEEQNRQEEQRQTEAYLYTIESNYQRTRELWHDLRNHISLLHLLLREGKYEQMRDYLKVFGEEVDQIALPVKSGNLIVDAVLADKTARAKRENIAVEIELCDLTGLPLKPDEICSLFGNLLDNAIEACLRVKGGKKIIITCRMRGRDTCFSVRNTLAEEEITQDKRLTSHKSDRENVVGHGLGLRSVERVVNRHAGEFVTDMEEGMFTAAVWLPGKGSDV